jgi:hypothetical protein
MKEARFTRNMLIIQNYKKYSIDERSKTTQIKNAKI